MYIGEDGYKQKKRRMEYLPPKTYLMTASHTGMSKGARFAVVLSGWKGGEVWKEIAYANGRN